MMGDSCIICGSVEKLHQHHISYYPEKTVCVCSKHHGEIHKLLTGNSLKYIDKHHLMKYLPSEQQLELYHKWFNEHHSRKHVTITLHRIELKKLEDIRKERGFTRSGMLAKLIQEYKEK